MIVVNGYGLMWRGGTPVERGPYPAQIEWRNVYERSDNPEMCQGWLADIEAVLARGGLALTHQTAGARTVFRAAGHQVAEVTPEGCIIYARPVGGSGPGARGEVAAESLRRSSTWL